MKKTLLFALFIIIFFQNAQSQIFPNPATLSTGQGVPGTLDPIWLVSPWYASAPNPIGLPYNPALINNNCAPGAWVNPVTLPPPVNNGNWITGSDAPCSTSTMDGYRYFRLTLNLPADCNGNSVTVAGNYVLYLVGYVDNTITDIFINGNSTGISGGAFTSGSQLSITLVGPWVAGINYVDVLVYNFPSGSGSVNPYGLLLVADAAATANADSDGDGVPDINDQCPCTPGSLANGCPASIVGDTIICKGESTTLTATGTGTYLWNTGSTNASITVSPILTSVYSVIITTSSGYQESSAINVTVNQPPLIFITGDTLLCTGENTTLTATGGGTYAWGTGSTNSFITVSPASSTTYKVVVTNANGCKDSLNQQVTVFQNPVSLYSNSGVCEGNVTPFTDQSTTPNGIINSWSWDFGDGSALNPSQSPSYTYTNAGTYNTTLIVHNSFGCADTLTKPVQVYYNPTAGFTHGDICLGDSMHFTNTSTINPSSSINSYLWVFGDGSASSNLQNPVHNYANSATYNVTLVTITQEGCSNSVSNTVNAFDAPVSTFTYGNTCLLDSVAFTNTSINPSMGTIASWSWDFGDNSPLNTVIWNPHHLYSSAGIYLVTLITHSSTLGCPDTVQTSLIVHPMPTVAKTITNVTCNGVCDGQITITPNGGTAPYTFSSNGGCITASCNNLCAGSYTITVTDSFGCSVTTDTIITEPTALIASVTGITQTSCNIICDGTATVSATGGTQGTGYNYSWNTVPFQNLTTATGLCAGSYTCTITDANGCSQAPTASVTLVPGPVITATATDYNIIEGNTTQLNASGGSSYHWTPSTGLSCDTCQSPTAKPAQTTTYCVLVTDLNACADSACLTINVEKPCPNFTVPNAFSPNNDGHNDKFWLEGWDNCVTKFHIIIYDRWGEKVFESSNASFNWDGTLAPTLQSASSGKQLYTEVFVYSINATLKNGDKITRNGNISLLR